MRSTKSRSKLNVKVPLTSAALSQPLQICHTKCESPFGIAALGQEAGENVSQNDEEPSAGPVVRGRRQRRWSGGTRPHVHKVSGTPEQEQQLVLRAALRGITIPALLMESALAGGAEQAADHAEFRDELLRLMRLMGRVSNNINQLARVANATQELAPETAATLEAHLKVLARLERLVESLGGAS